MEIAVGVNAFHLIPFAEGKADLGSVAGVQLLALVALLGVDGNPLDVVLRQHGMGHGTDLDMDDAIFDRPNGEVLFYSGIGGIGDDLAHFFTAADHRYTGILYLGDDIAAMFANIEFLFHRGSSFSK